jgi:diadenosine tetraphosphate (Ap4A) HIT family hydrolase
MDECQICAKHRGEGDLVGPLIWEDDLVVVTHIPRDAYGYVFVETRRHAPYVDNLTEPEAEAVGRTVRRAAIALRVELSPSYVFSAIAGRGVAHFHQHIWARPPEWPDDLRWDDTSWPGATPRTEADIAELSARLTAHF